LLVDIKRGEQRLIPAGNTRIRSGDFLYILTHNKNIVLLQQLTSEKQTKK
jgi:Trk K+ transport system NAD-binding subunit